MGRWRRMKTFSDHAYKSLFSLTAILILCSEFCTGQEFFPPPTIWIDRHWSIPEDEPIGTKVAQAKASEEDPNLEFSLEPSAYNDGSGFFRIDSKTGSVYLNASMQGKSGKQYYLSVQARSGSGIPIKTEIWMEITPASSSSTPKQKGPIGIPTKPVHAPPSGTIIAHDGRPITNVPVFPPNLTPPPNAVTPALPFDTQLSTSSPPVTLPPKADNPLSSEVPTGITTSEGSQMKDEASQPQYPPHLINSNKNNIYHIGDSGENNHDVNHDVINLTSSTEKAIENNDLEVDLTGTGPSKQVISSPTVTNSTLGGGSGKNDATNYIVIFTIVPIVLIFGVVPIVVASIWLVRRRTRRVKKRPTKEMRKESAATSNSSSMTMSGEPVSPSALRQWIKQAQSNRYESWNPEGADSANSGNRWEFPRHHLQVGRILGEGCFGQVWQCDALNIDSKEGVTTVAVKTLKEGAGDRERADLLSELAVMKMLDPHPHVVRLLGACTEKDPILLIMEYVALGKLQSFLRNSRSSHYYPNLHADSNSLSSKDLTAFCYQIARGMEYLASKGIIHRDLAARNILIDKERVCKVADFGFARDVVANHVYERKTDGRLPVRWMAPEALYDNVFTTKTDIWSFGVLMWEIVTLGSTPYPGISAAEVMRKVREGYRLEKPDHCRRELYNIMFYCWAGSPDDRPTFADLVNFLKHLLFSETDYIELDRFPDHDYYNYMSNQTSGEKL